MSTWAEVKDSIREAIVAASVLPDGAVVWAEEGEPIADPYVRLSIVSNVEYTEPRETLEENLAGDYDRSLDEIRDVMIQVRAESVNEGSNGALTLINALRLRLYATANDAIMLAHSVHVSDMPVQNLTYLSGKQYVGARAHSFIPGDRVIHAYAFDMLVRARFSYDDPTATGVIEKVLMSGELEDPDISVPEWQIPAA